MPNHRDRIAADASKLVRLCRFKHLIISALLTLLKIDTLQKIHIRCHDQHVKSKAIDRIYYLVLTLLWS